MSIGVQTGTRPQPRLIISDRVFNVLLLSASIVVVALVAVLGVTLARNSAPAFQEFGWRFITGTSWDPVHEVFGALPFIWGTMMSSFIALVLAVPVGLGAAIFLAELAPGWLSRPIGFMVEMLAAVPSVVYGLWGIFVAAPVIQSVEMFLSDRWGHFPLFAGPPIGFGMLAAGTILAIMILPFIAWISRDAICAVPRGQSEAGLALGTTRWETIRGPILRYAGKGIIGGIILALGRALGETMAVTMLIGNTPTISISLFESGYSMSSVLANEFAEAMGALHSGSMAAIALLLLVVTFIVNAMARLLIWGCTARYGEGSEA